MLLQRFALGFLRYEGKGYSPAPMLWSLCTPIKRAADIGARSSVAGATRGKVPRGPYGARLPPQVGMLLLALQPRDAPLLVSEDLCSHVEEVG